MVPISADELDSLLGKINSEFKAYKISFNASCHFTTDRLNDQRNKPSINLSELDKMLNAFLLRHVNEVVDLPHGVKFNIRCLETDINIPCGISRNRSDSTQMVMITIMRKKDFIARDDIEFRV